MHSSFAKKTLTILTLKAFILCSAIPTDAISTQTDSTRIFGLCKAKRMKKRVDELLVDVQNIECDATYEEILFKLAAFTEEINTLFETNHELETVAQWALDELREYIEIARKDSLQRRQIEPLVAQIHAYGSENSPQTDEEAQYFDEQTAKMIYGYVSIFCGCLLCALPFGWTDTLGRVLIESGAQAIGRADCLEEKGNTKQR